MGIGRIGLEKTVISHGSHFEAEKDISPTSSASLNLEENLSQKLKIGNNGELSFRLGCTVVQD